MSNTPSIIHCWSGPRSLSTATMYSFSMRENCKVLDEPLYAVYLKKFAQLHRPYRHQLVQSSPSETVNDVLNDINNMPNELNKLIFCKHIAKQATPDIDFNLLTIEGTRHLLLIRDPLDMILSWDHKNDIHKEGVTLDSTCLPQLVHIYSKIRELTGVAPVVIDTTMLESCAEYVLQEACQELGIPFSHQQLSWPSGPKPEIDGIWAPFWYDSVHQSTGFENKKAPTYLRGEVGSGISPSQLAVYREALPFYDMLRRHAVCINPLSGQRMTQSTSLSTVIDHGIAVTPNNPLQLLADKRNADILVYINGRLLPRESAKISVLDSAVQGGDAVWEGVRVYNGRVFKLDEHIGRLIDSAKAMSFQNVPLSEDIKDAIFRTLLANGMMDGAHMRVTLTRGLKITSSMNPQFNVFGCTLVVLPEWKPVGSQATYDNTSGIKLITATNRRNGPSCVDSKIHHCNLINNILPKIQANNAGAADALMLDADGFVSETNATNVFMVKNGQIFTPHADYCLPGITRKTIIEMVSTLSCFAPVIERRISLAEFHCADEVFTTGTMGEISPVIDIDGRIIGRGTPGPITFLIQQQFRKITENAGVAIPTCEK